MAEFDINELLQNPAFTAGLAGLLAPSQDRYKAILGGVATGTAAQQAAQQKQMNALKLAALQKQQAFNPQDYMQGSNGAPGTNTPAALEQMQQQPAMPAGLGGVLGGATPMQPPQPPQQIAQPPESGGGQLDLQGLLSGGLQAGYSPGEVAGMAGMMDPAAAARAKLEAQSGVVGPGATFVQGGKPVYTNTNPPPGGITQQISQLTNMRDAAAAKGDTANAQLFQTALDHVSGTAEAQQAAARMDELKAQHAATNDFRTQTQQRAEENQNFAQDQKVNSQTTQFSNQIQKIGLPQAQQQLTTIQGIIDKYKDKKELPGYGMVDSLLPTAMLPQEGQQLRQAVASFANVLLKTRSGAAVTDPEQRRFMEELGNGKLVSSARLKQGIGQMQSLLDAEKKNAAAGVSQDVLDRYSEQGGDIDFSGFRGGRPSGKKAAVGVSIDNASLDDLKALRAARRGQ
jgi:hypothetical protein